MEALVETCLPPDNEIFSLENNLNSAKNGTMLSYGYQNNSNTNINQSTSVSANNVSSNFNLITGSMSSISLSSLHSPVDLFEFNELNRTCNSKIRRNSSPKNLM